MNKKRLLLIHLIIIMLFSYVLFFYGIGDYSLKEPDEGRYAEIPREMVELNDYTVPHMNYTRYFEKPPLFYWMVAVSYKLFGVSEWSFRLPNALSAFLCVLALYILSRRWFGEKTAFLSSLVLISSFGFFAMARTVTLDMHFTLWLFLSLLLFYGYFKEKKVLFLYLFYASLAFATLTKGLVSVILVPVTIFIFLILENNIAFLKEMKWIKGLAVFFAVALPWFLLISIKEKEFFYFFFIDQQVLRFLTSKHKRTGSLFYFAPVLFAGMFPWSVFIPRSFVELWGKHELKLFIIWSLIVFLFFSISKSKLPPYILPVFPAVSLILGNFFAEKWDNFAKKRLEIGIYICIFAVISLIPASYYMAAVKNWVSSISMESGQIFTDLKHLFVAISAVSVITLLVLSFRTFNRHAAVYILLISFSSLMMLFFLMNIKIVDRLNTTKHLCTYIYMEKGQFDYLINYSSFDETMPFYTRRRVVIASYTGELKMGSKYDDARDFFITEAEFLKLFQSDKKIFCMLKAKRLKTLREKMSKPFNTIKCQNERCLIRNY